MIVMDSVPTVPDPARPWPANHPEAAAKRHSRPADPNPPEDNGDRPMMPLVSPPPLIPRVFPGL
jgi:hypothetical protein